MHVFETHSAPSATWHAPKVPDCADARRAATAAT